MKYNTCSLSTAVAKTGSPNLSISCLTLRTDCRSGRRVLNPSTVRSSLRALRCSTFSGCVAIRVGGRLRASVFAGLRTLFSFVRNSLVNAAMSGAFLVLRHHHATRACAASAPSSISGIGFQFLCASGTTTLSGNTPARPRQSSFFPRSNLAKLDMPNKSFEHPARI